MNHTSPYPHQELYRVLSVLDTPEAVHAFLEDLCTVQEVAALSQRLQVAEMLSHGLSYTDISGKTGASSATISRVSRCLNHGAGGYRAALQFLKGETP